MNTKRTKRTSLRHTRLRKQLSHHGFFEIVSDLFLAVLIVLYFFADLVRKFLDMDPIQKFVAVWISGCGIMTSIGLYYLFLGLN